jgi:hypothetical protein
MARLAILNQKQSLSHIDAFPKHRSVFLTQALSLPLAPCLKYLNLGNAMLQEKERQPVLLTMLVISEKLYVVGFR